MSLSRFATGPAGTSIPQEPVAEEVDDQLTLALKRIADLEEQVDEFSLALARITELEAAQKRAALNRQQHNADYAAFSFRMGKEIGRITVRLKSLEDRLHEFDKQGGAATLRNLMRGHNDITARVDALVKSRAREIVDVIYDDEETQG